MKNEQTYEFTLRELARVIDQSFILGKMYATDELQACGTHTQIPLYNPKRPQIYREYVKEYGLGELHSTEAKMDVLTESLRHKLFTNLHDLFED